VQDVDVTRLKEEDSQRLAVAERPGQPAVLELAGVVGGRVAVVPEWIPLPQKFFGRYTPAGHFGALVLGSEVKGNQDLKSQHPYFERCSNSDLESLRKWGKGIRGTVRPEKAWEANIK
jgi:hypothetical protein